MKTGKNAVVVAETGAKATYAELHVRSARLASLLAKICSQGDVIAILLSNRFDYFEVCFGARRARLSYVLTVTSKETTL